MTLQRRFILIPHTLVAPDASLLSLNSLGFCIGIASHRTFSKNTGLSARMTFEQIARARRPWLRSQNNEYERLPQLYPVGHEYFIYALWRLHAPFNSVPFVARLLPAAPCPEIGVYIATNKSLSQQIGVTYVGDPIGISRCDFAGRLKLAFHGIHQPRISRCTGPVLAARVEGMSTRFEASLDYLPLNIPI